jgi:putative endopeptidase
LENENTDDKINGYTAKQRFFLAWTCCWRENSKKERELQLVTLDPHAHNEFRANGPLSNMPEFYEAFDITTEDTMYREENKRVNIW